MSSLHLIAVDPSKRAVAISAVKAMLLRVGRFEAEDAELWQKSQEAVYHVLGGRGPYPLVLAEAHIIDAAVEAFQAVVGDSAAAALERDLVGDVEVPAPDASMVKPKPTADLPVNVGAVPGAVDLSREGIEAAMLAPTAEDFEPSYQAARTALLLMSMFDGKAVPAWFWAKALAQSTEDVDLWVEVGNLIVETFGFSKNPTGTNGDV